MNEDTIFENEGMPVDEAGQCNADDVFAATENEQTNVHREAAPQNPMYAPYGGTTQGTQMTPNNSGFERKKKKRGNAASVIAIIACMVVFMLVGGIVGGAIGSGFFNKDNDLSAGNNTKAPENTVTPTDNGEKPSENVVYGDGAKSGTASQVTDKCKASVVSIYVEIVSNSYFYGESVSKSSGSGVIITEDGYIVTCNHVVNGATSVKVNLQDGTEYEATLVGYDSRTDLAVIKIDATGLSAATIGTSESYKVGDEVYAIGNPLGEYESTVTRGIISGFDRSVEIDGTTMTLMQTDAAINPGNSGGGLFSTETGELLGIVNAKSYGVEIEGIGFAIPTETVKSIATDLMDLGYVSGRPYVGITMQNASISDGSSGGAFGFGGTYRSVVMVTYVAENSPAATAGLKVGDYIAKVGDTEISTTDEFRGALNNYNAGDTVTITVQRSNQTLEITVTLGESSGNN